MGETIPPVSKSQPASDHDDDDYAHEAVTIAPPAPNFDDMLLSGASPLPSLSQRSDQHFRAALDAGERAGSSLSELSKMIGELSGGLIGAKRANEQLVHELSTLRAMLGSANEQQLGLRHQIAQLEQQLLQAKISAEDERRFLTDQHDDFLAALLEEHEEALRSQVSEGELARTREALGKAQQQRDEARTRAEKLERERDELRAESSQLRARLGTHRPASTAPPPSVASRPPSFRPQHALQLDAGELDATLHARSASSPRLPSVIPRFTPAPPELQQAVVRRSQPPVAHEFPRESTRPGVGGPKPSRAPAPSPPLPPADFGPPPSGWTPVPPAPQPSPAPRAPVFSAASMPPSAPGHRPALKQKPDPTTRPLIDYSVGGDGLASERLEGVRLTTKPPKK